MSAMDFNAEAETVSGAASNSSEPLQSWHQQYDAMHGDALSLENYVIQAVQSDHLDRDQIERNVQQLVPTADVDRGFCEKCRDLLGHWPEPDPDRAREWPGHCVIARRMNTYEIEAAARAGCRFCAFLTSRLKLQSLFDTFRKIEARFCKLGDSRTASLAVLNSGLVQAHWLNFPGKVATHFRYDPQPLPCAFLSHTLPPTALNLNPDEFLNPFEVAKTWLTRCDKDHEPCRRKTPHQPPTRLVSVGHLGQNAVRVVITANLEKPPPYATLSYCWGRKRFTKLTQGNLEAFLDRIPIQSLPRTLVDAIHVTRQLGLQYIWIDSLCIIQDDPDEEHDPVKKQDPVETDWYKEAGRMRSVYGGAYVNLAVSTAQNAHEGFLDRQQLSGGFVAKVSKSGPDTVQGFYSLSTYGEVTENSHLARRAWTFQERLLPARTIYFSETGLFWECCSHLASEALPDKVPPSRFSSLLCSDDRPWKQWSEIVRMYSGANLTRSSDRLPALSGIAQRQHELTGDTYLAGLWRNSLITQLSWEVSGPRRPRPDPPRAPTWSWASVDDQSSYSGDVVPRDGRHPDLLPKGRATHFIPSDGETREYVQIEQAWTKPLGSDRHGAVSDGELTLLCSHLIRGRISKSSAPLDSRYFVLMPNRIGRADVQLDCVNLVSEDDVVYLLPLVDREFSGIRDSHVRKTICGLILRACDNSPGHFERVGCFRLPKLGDDGQDLYHVFKVTLREERTSTAEFDHTVARTAMKDGQLWYKIIIE